MKLNVWKHAHLNHATYARLLVTLVHSLYGRNLRRGIAALCLGGGEAVAIAVEA